MTISLSKEELVYIKSLISEDVAQSKAYLNDGDDDFQWQIDNGESILDKIRTAETKETFKRVTARMNKMVEL